MPAIICGSLAFDMIANYESKFSDAVLPDQLHILNVSFYTPRMRREFGGCAANIAYTLKALGAEPKILATIGKDGQDYLERFRSLEIDTSLIKTIDDSFTAQCFIITDITNNQINAFHPGAMEMADQLNVPHDDQSIEIGIIAPDGRQAMINHANQMYQAKIPFIFDPGQGLPMFDGEALKKFLTMATWVTTNDYEAKLLCDRTGLSLQEISEMIPGALYVTLGGKGSEVWEKGERTPIDPVVVDKVVDPTGCGDAYRAGLLYGLEQGWSSVHCANLGSALGARKIVVQGPQNHILPANFVQQFAPQ